MPITTKESMSGFIASQPVLSVSEQGVARMYVKVGQEHNIYNEETGTFTQGKTSFHDLVAFRGTAERAAAMFTKGDHFIAEGRTETRTATLDDGHTEQQDEFIATRIGHDTAMTRYTVDRTPRVQQTPTCPDGPTNTPAIPATKIGRHANTATADLVGM